ncbi:YbaK/aminoacyl-tRNA synthetase-associated domain-containing protein [Jimgerdemannia flammicorona]|uniref:YbaK/aminoacyl-tRNA synthetase-associated domain-containing protein n=1 Tax=Jimgerdemannia flammicorona TaxID=994334 RepID=A0A433D5F6_9FUNG|nr:YbaK/aminoacyl-tRNA synthetase-associated domain-containing protein [Jimgerdemannia flammicorona]
MNYNGMLNFPSFRLLAPSQAHLCKSVVFENTRCTHNEISNPLNSKYYCVIVQYVASINTQKLMNYVRALNNNLISRKNYNMRLTSPENSLALTGFDYGGVSPIGMKQPVPVILSEAIVELQPPVFFLGAGHVDWKIAMPIDDFLKATKCFMADLS